MINLQAFEAELACGGGLALDAEATLELDVGSTGTAHIVVWLDPCEAAVGVERIHLPAGKQF